METNDIPTECLQNSQFSMVLKATLETEIQKKQQKLKDVQDQIENVKKSIKHKYNEKKTMSQLLEVEKDKSKIFEPMLKVLSASCEEKKFELLFLKEDLDSGSLKMKDEQLKYQEIIATYKNTWEMYQKKYENLDGAIQRKEIKIKIEKAKVQLMNLEYKRKQFLIKFEQREAINDMRLKALMKEMSQLVLDRWKQQNYQSKLTADIANLNKQYEGICEKLKKIQQKIEEDTKAKVLARELMPAPRIDSIMLRSVYSATPRSTEKKIRREYSLGSDNISLCSSIIDQLYSGNEKLFDKISNRKAKEKDVESLQKLSCECSHNTDTDEQISQNLQYERNVNVLENECRHLSIDEESIREEHNDELEDSNNVKPQQIICEAIIETPRLPVSTEAYLNPISHSKKKLSKSIDSIHSIHSISAEPQKKRPKRSDSAHENSLTSYDTEDKKNITQISTKRNLPSIKKIEILSEPIKIQSKPPMAEVPPTPNLFSNLHYTPSCTSNEDDPLSMMDDENYHDIDTNWQNFTSLNRADSVMSFMSNASMFKNIVYDTRAMPAHSSEIISNHSIAKESNPALSTNQTNDTASNFFTCFNVQPSTQNFF